MLIVVTVATHTVPSILKLDEESRIGLIVSCTTNVIRRKISQVVEEGETICSGVNSRYFDSRRHLINSLMQSGWLHFYGKCRDKLLEIYDVSYLL